MVLAFLVQSTNTDEVCARVLSEERPLVCCAVHCLVRAESTHVLNFIELRVQKYKILTQGAVESLAVRAVLRQCMCMTHDSYTYTARADVQFEDFPEAGQASYTSCLRSNTIYCLKTAYTSSLMPHTLVAPGHTR